MTITSSPPLTSGKVALAMLDTVHQLKHAAAGGPDAELLTLCAEFQALEREVKSTPHDDEATDALMDKARPLQSALVKRIVALPPQTLEGFRAMARTIVCWAPDMLDNSNSELGGLHGDLNSALLRALTGRVTSIVNPDADLIAICAEIDRLEDAIYSQPGDVCADDPLVVEQTRLHNRTMDLTATTLEGCRARARTIAKCAPDLMNAPDDVLGEMISWLLHDLLEGDASTTDPTDREAGGKA